jgi:hypothetical protein
MASHAWRAEGTAFSCDKPNKQKTAKNRDS